MNRKSWLGCDLFLELLFSALLCWVAISVRAAEPARSIPSFLLMAGLLQSSEAQRNCDKIPCQTPLNDTTQVSDTDDFISHSKIRALSQKGRQAIPEIVKALDDDNSLIRQTAVMALGNMGSEAKGAISSLLAVVRTDSDSLVKGKAIIAIISISAGRKVLVDITALPHEETNTVDLTLIPIFLDTLRDKNGFVRSCSAAALGFMGHQSHTIVPVLIAALRDKNSLVRAQACASLARLGGKAKAAIPQLKQLIQDQDCEVQVNVANALWEIDRQASVAAPVLLGVLANELRGERDMAILYRQSQPRQDESSRNEKTDKEAWFDSVFEDLLPHNSIRLKAMECLNRIGPEAIVAIPVLKKLLKDEGRCIRVDAAILLWKLEKKPESICPVLLEAIEDKGFVWTSRFQLAVQTLEKMGPKAQAALPALRKLQSHKDNDIRKIATEAIKKIDLRK